MLRYKAALISVGALYYRLAIFLVVGSVYCSVVFVRYLRNSYIERFQETSL